MSVVSDVLSVVWAERSDVLLVEMRCGVSAVNEAADVPLRWSPESWEEGLAESGAGADVDGCPVRWDSEFDVVSVVDTVVASDDGCGWLWFHWLETCF